MLRQPLRDSHNEDTGQWIRETFRKSPIIRMQDVPWADCSLCGVDAKYVRFGETSQFRIVCLRYYTHRDSRRAPCCPVRPCCSAGDTGRSAAPCRRSPRGRSRGDTARRARPGRARRDPRGSLWERQREGMGNAARSERDQTDAKWSE